ncbi:hypothetical protein CHU98_g361 [Xylaria longipes]|nr:hypothetical protein CHU98_g361 [Xylaria longipes]
MARSIILRLRYLLPLPRSFRLTPRLPKAVRSFLSGSHAPRPRKLHSTSYLDGLRGLAALVVCVCHYTEANHPGLTAWYGVSSDPAPAREPSWIQLPFVRVMFSGRAHGPCILRDIGLRVVCESPDGGPSARLHEMPFDTSIRGAAPSAARAAFALASVVYCLHCAKWAAAEFVGGMLLAEAHLVREERETRESLPLVNSPLYPSNSQGDELEPSRRKKRNSTINAMETILHSTILTAALFIAGWPNMDPSRTPGIRHLVDFVSGASNPRDPQGPQKFWFAIAAMGAVWSCGRLAFVRKMILESRFAQDAGRISFAVYIVHGPVLTLFQDAVLGGAGSKGSGLRGWIGIDTAFNRTLCWATGLAVLFPLVLVAAHFFCRFVDEPLCGWRRKLRYGRFRTRMRCWSGR